MPMTLTSLTQLGALAALGAAVFVLALALLPMPRALDLVGLRARQRADALGKSLPLRLAWPVVDTLASFIRRLPLAAWRARATVTLREAGSPFGMDADELLAFRVTCTAGGLAAAGLLVATGRIGSGLYAVGLMMGLLMPPLWLGERKRLRWKAINRGLPQALDLVVMAMGAGLDFPGAVRNVVERWTNREDPLYDELSRFLHDLTLGRTRREALTDLAVRAPTEIVKTFVTNVIQSEQRGTPLVEVLAIQAGVARSRRFQSAEQAAGRAGALIMLPLLLILGAVFLIIIGGLIVRGIRGTLIS